MHTHKTSTEDIPSQWYKQFWPWFVISFPALAVVAGVITIYIAFSNADSLVKDSYYKEGLAINQQLAQDIEATRLEINADIKVDTLSGEVFVELQGDINFSETLNLLLIHPGEESQDQTINLKLVQQNQYRGDLESIAMQKYYLRLQAGENSQWRLNGVIDFSRQNYATLLHD